MNVSLKNVDALSAIIKIEIEKNDYAEQVDKSLRKLRQKANLPGFRPGMTPLGYIKKIYGKQILAEEVNKLFTDNLNKYLEESKLDIIGNPIPSISEQKPINFDTDENFEFSFDIALQPEFDVQLSKNDLLLTYKVTIDDEIIDKEIESYRRRNGSFENLNTVTIESLVKGQMVELEDGAPKVDGVIQEDASFLLSYFKGKMEQKKFIGANVGSTIIFNPYKAYKGADIEIASLLGIEREAVKNMKNDFSFEIIEISQVKPAELDQELYDKIFGKDVVKDETDFRDQIKDSLLHQSASSVEMLLNIDIQKLLLSKASEVVFADDLLKRWLLFADEKTTLEAIEKDFPHFIIDLKKNIIKRKLVKAFNIQVENEDVLQAAEQAIRSQLMQYGRYSMSDEEMQNYIKDMLTQKETVQALVSRVLDEKVTEKVKETITIEEKEVTVDEFREITEGK